MQIAVWRGLARLLAVGLLCALPVAALAAANFPAEGARGDRGDSDECEPGEFMVGARFRAGSWIDQVQIRCAILDPATGTLGTAYSRGRPRGSIGGIGGSAHCPDDMWVRRIGIWFTGGNRQVRHVGASCEFPSPNGRPEQFFTFGPGGGGASTVRHQCPPGEAAAGLNIRSGQHVNALGLICRKIPPLGKALRRLHENTDFRGSDLSRLIVTTATSCEANCKNNNACRAWTYVKPGQQGPSGVCYLKNTLPRAYLDTCCTSGVKAQ
jgi:hypothetical protein